MENIISLDLSAARLSEYTGEAEMPFWEEHAGYREALQRAQERLNSGKEPGTGWVDFPNTYIREELRRMLEVARNVRRNCEAFVLIGVGGSYLGARATVDALTAYGKGSGSLCSSEEVTPKFYYAGYNLSSGYHAQLLDELKDKEVCVCVVSKSGETVESGVAFLLFKEFLIRKYGETEARRRIYTITSPSGGSLRKETDQFCYEGFEIPDDIGGRYSLLTAVGMFPAAVAGIDIYQILQGAEDMARREQGKLSDAAKLAAARQILFQRGKVIEAFEAYEPCLNYFVQWLKQLFAESEGKEGKGIFPAALSFSADLHSMGQFLQEGNQIFFETVLDVQKTEKDMIIPEDSGNILDTRSMHQMNRMAAIGVARAHQKVGIPMIRLDIPALTPYHFGQMVYFFETACALSGYLFGINPFDQPGVEHYKLEMRNALAK